MILILTHKRGFEADHVIDILKQRDVPFFRFNSDFDADSKINNVVSIPKSLVKFESDHRSLLLSDVSVAWFQQPPPQPEFDSRNTLIQTLQNKNFQASYYWALKQIQGRWLNNPFKVLNAANKLFQLESALKVGLFIPDTLVTNSYSDVLNFYKKHQKQVIVKNLATPWYINSKGKTVAAYTKLLTSDHLREEKICVTPLIYQEYIERKYDVRVVVIGTDIFTAATPTTENIGKYDIRRIPFDKIDYMKIDLPINIRDKIIALMSYLDLQYASIDFTINQFGQYFFLDLNCTGAFIWLESIVKYPISEKIVNFLIGKDV